MAVTHPLNALDNLFFLLESPTTPMHVGGVLVFGGRDRRKRLTAELASMQQETSCASPFDRRFHPPRLPLARWQWEASGEVDPGPHIARHRAPGAGGERELMQLVSELHSAPIDHARPLWECHLIDGLTDGRFAFYYKVHHACIDGVSGIRRMQGALSGRPEDATPAIWSVAPPRSSRGRSAPPPVSRRLLDKVRAVHEVARGIGHVTTAALRRDDTASAAPYAAPRTPLNEMIGAERSVSWCRLPLDGIKRLGRAAGATVNEVALALSAAILRERLELLGALPARPLVAMVPFSLRGDDDDAPPTGNDVSCFLANLATHEADPAERLRLIVASSRDGKRLLREMSRDAAEAYWIAVGFPAILAQLAGLARHAPLPFNVVVSNVPGPRGPLYHNGAGLEAIYPVSLLFERQGLNITLVGNRDHLDVGLLACRRAVPDLPALAARLPVAYAELRDAVLG